MTQSEILHQLEADLRSVLEEVRQTLFKLDEPTLRRRPENPKSWNILECFEHLNRHVADYMPQIELAIHKAKAHSRHHRPDEEVRYNFIGRQSLKWVSASNLKKYKTAKKYNPLGQPVAASAVKSFIINGEKILRLIQMSRDVDINGTKVRFAIMPVFKFRLANLLVFIVLHAQKHIAQARQLLSAF